jgi:hypothetical protein
MNRLLIAQSITKPQMWISGFGATSSDLLFLHVLELIQQYVCQGAVLDGAVVPFE